MKFIESVKKRFFKKRRTIFELFVEHAERSLEAVSQLELCIRRFVAGTLTIKDVDKLDKIEDEGDIISLKLLKKLFKGALLPYTSQDWFELVELIDNLADDSERVGKLLLIHDIKMSKKIERKLIRLMRKSIECSKIICDGVALLNDDMIKAKHYVSQVGEKRHEARLIEYEIYADMFKSEKLSYKELMTLKEIVYWITQISNTSKKAANRLSMMAVKYSF